MQNKRRMFNMRKFLSSLICFLLVVSLLSGCKNGTSNTGTSGKTTIKSSATTTAGKQTQTGTKTTSKGSTASSNTLSEHEGASGNDDEEGGPDVPDDSDITENRIDFNGQTIVISEWDNTNKPVFGVSEGQDRTYKAFNEALVKYNCNVEWKELTWANYHNEFTQSMLAGLKFADIATTYTTFAFPNFVKQGFIIPIQDYVDFSKGQFFNEGLRWAGQLYHLQAQQKQFNYVTIYNPKLLDNAGMGDIWPLVKENRWNFETFLEYARILTIDFNGDGAIDQWGTGGQLYPSLAYANGVSPLALVDGKIASGLHQGAGMRALQFMFEVFSVYKVSDTYGGTKPDFYNGKVATWLVAAGEARNAFIAGITDISMAPLPMGPDVTDYQMYQFGGGGFTIPSNSGYGAKELITFLSEALYSTSDPDSEYYMDPREGYISWQTANSISNAQLHADMYDTAQKSREKIFDLAGGITGLPQLINSTIANPVQQGRKSPGVALAETEASYQELIDAALQ